MQILSILSIFLVFAAVSSSFPIENTITITNSTTATAAASCVCTTVACPVPGANYLNGWQYNYRAATDADQTPVVTSAYAIITTANLDTGSDTTSCTQQYSRMLEDDGTNDCDAGHILANRLGGPGNQPINIFPQDLSVNRGAYAQFEDYIYDCVRNGGSPAELSWTFTYNNNSRTMPIYLYYTARFSGGSCDDVTENFQN